MNGPKKLQKILKAFLEDESGQTTTEYIVILAIVIGVAAKFRQTIMTQVSNLLSQIQGKLDQATNGE